MYRGWGDLARGAETISKPPVAQWAGGIIYYILLSYQLSAPLQSVLHQDILKKKNRMLAKLQGEINSAIGRLKNSASAEACVDLKGTLEDLLLGAKSATTFQSMAMEAAPAPEVFFQAMNEVLQLGCEVGPSYYKFALCLQGRQAPPN